VAITWPLRSALAVTILGQKYGKQRGGKKGIFTKTEVLEPGPRTQVGLDPWKLAELCLTGDNKSRADVFVS